MKFYNLETDVDELIDEFMSVLKEFGINVKEQYTEKQGEYYITFTYSIKPNSEAITINRSKRVNITDADKAHDLAECLRCIGIRTLYSGCDVSLIPELLKLIDENIDHLSVASEPKDYIQCTSDEQDDSIYIHTTYTIPVTNNLTTEDVRKMVGEFVNGAQ